MVFYDLNSFYTILKKGNPYMLGDDVIEVIRTLDLSIVPIFVEPKKVDLIKKKKFKPSGIPEKWDDRSGFKTTQVVIVEKSGVEKWLQEIRTGLNKLSAKNYDSQKTEIIQCIQNCIDTEDQPEEHKKVNLRTIATAIFNIASTNKFYAELYAKLYKELIPVNIIFQEILLLHVANYASSVKDIEYFNPENDK